VSEFNPQSSDSMFTQILTEMKEIKYTLECVREQTTKTNGRVTLLETYKNIIVWMLGFIALLVPAYIEMRRK